MCTLFPLGYERAGACMAEESFPDPLVLRAYSKAPSTTFEKQHDSPQEIKYQPHRNGSRSTGTGVTDEPSGRSAPGSCLPQSPVAAVREKSAKWAARSASFSLTPCSRTAICALKQQGLDIQSRMIWCLQTHYYMWVVRQSRERCPVPFLPW